MQRRPMILPNTFPFHREPRGEALRARAPHLLRESLRTHPTPRRDPVVVDAHPPAASPDEHRAQLMLGPDAVELRLILELEQKMQRASQSELLVQPPLRGRLHGLIPPGMTAAA